MKVKQAKLAQSIRGETSNILTDLKYHLEFKSNMLHIQSKAPSNYGPFVVFPANLAYLEIATEDEDPNTDPIIPPGPKVKKK